MNSRTVFASFVRGAEVPEDREARAPIARASLLALLSAYGRSPQILDFFNVYADLADRYETGTSDSSDLYRRFVRGLDMMDSRITSEGTRNRLASRSSELLPYLRRLDGGANLSAPQWRDVVEVYADLIAAVAADKDIFLRSRRLPGEKPVKWLRLQKATAKEEATERLRKEDPDLYARLYVAEAQKRELNDRIRERIVSDGREPAVRMIMNRPVMIGFAPLTGREPVTLRKRDGKPYLQRDMLIYEPDGKTYTLSEFKERVLDSNRVQEELRVNPAPNMKMEGLDSLRAYTANEVDAALPSDSKERKAAITSISLSDDPSRSTSLTRIYEVAEINGEEVVVSGRFKGFRVSELVNTMGRQIEGSVYYVSPETGKNTRREIRNADGTVDVRRSTEPYVTLNKGKLLLQLPNTPQYREVRVALKGGIDADGGKTKGLMKLIPSLKLLTEGKGPRPQFFEFEAKDFAAIQDVTGSLAQSASAAKFLREYYEDLIRAEQASEAKNLSRYSGESLGLKKPLRRHVQKALAWLDANENRGICALDTGMGKTVTTIASIQNLLKKGKIEKEENNGLFLYVCEAKLKGNLPKELYSFLEKSEAIQLSKRIRVISYTEFNRNRKADPTFGDDFVAIYFDEAHIRMASRTSVTYQYAVSSKCKRKILLTASPMTKSPVQVLTLASVAEGTDLNSEEGRIKEHNFLSRFAETVGGRIVGIKQEDPVTARDFRVWVKRNLFFADKRDVVEEDAKLGNLIVETEAISMSPEVEAMYRVELAKVLRSMEELMATDFAGLPELAFEKIRNRAKRPLSLLSKLADVPDSVIPGATNPKLDRAVQLVADRVGRRTMFWTDRAAFAASCFSKMLAEFPGQGHVLGLSDRIVYAPPSAAMANELVETFKLAPLQNGVLTFKKRSYLDPLTGRMTKGDEWSTHVLSKILGLGETRTNVPVGTCTLTGTYAVGQNLQSFSTVIHLDRDDWSSETMKQRTARAWRSGNSQPVEEITLDLVFQEPSNIPEIPGDAEKTLDQVRKVIQDMDANLFKQVVLDSQSEKLGEEWLALRKDRSALHQIDKKMALRALSPYASQMGGE